MKILSIETTGHFASVALNSRQIMNDTDYSHLEEIAPMCLEILNAEKISGSDLDAIAVSKGPGSFTGIRIGIATAKGLSQIWDKAVIAVPTLESFAYREGVNGVVVPVFDARRSQVYAGIFKDKEVLLNAGAYDIEEFKSKLTEITENETEVHFFGDGCHLIEKESEGVQEAKQVLALAEKMFAEGKLETCYSVSPEYLRMAEAERKLQEKKNNERQ